MLLSLAAKMPYRVPRTLRDAHDGYYVYSGPVDVIERIQSAARAWIGFVHGRVVPIWRIDERRTERVPIEHSELAITIVTAYEMGTKLFAHAGTLESPAHRADWLVPEIVALADALTEMAAFAPGFVHGRLTPRTVYVGDDGFVRLRPPIDPMFLGEARYVDDPYHAGQNEWTSPEALRGEHPTPASDVFQLAMLMYAAITGARPYVPEHLLEGPLAPSPLGIPEPLAAVLVRNLSRALAERDPTPAAFAGSLRSCWSTVIGRASSTWMRPGPSPQLPTPAEPLLTRLRRQDPIGTTTYRSRGEPSGKLLLTKTIYPEASVLEFTGEPVRLDEVAAGTEHWLGFSHSRVLSVLSIEDSKADDGERQLVIVTASDHFMAMVDYVRKRWQARGAERTQWAVEGIIAVADGLAAMAAHLPSFVHCYITTDALVVDHDANVVLRPPVEGYAIGHHRCVEDHVRARSLLWVSPEALRGREIDARSDVFELATQLYTAIAGTSPFRQFPETFESMKEVIEGAAPARLPVPRPLDDLVLRNLSRDPADRDASPAAFAASLRGVW